jgi:amidophosphoribosyltransferase
MKEILQPLKKACSFERIYFSRGSDANLSRKKKLGKLILPAVLNAIDQDTDNTVFLIFLILPKHHFMV